MRLYFRFGAERFAGDEARPKAGVLVGWKILHAVMREGRRIFFVRGRESDPRLNAVHLAAVGPRLFEALGVRDPAPGGHPIHFAWLDRLLGADTIAMHDFASEQVGDRRQADMRMRTHVDGLRNAGGKIDRAHVIEKDERPDHASRCCRQHAADFKSAEIAATLFDDELDHLIAMTRSVDVPCARMRPPPSRT